MKMPLVFPYAQNSRAIGLADMVKAIRTGGKHRANGDLTYHVLEVITGFERSSRQGNHIMLESTFDYIPLIK